MRGLRPSALETNRLQYNEVVKKTTEEQLLLNIVRLRYTDTPSSLAVSVIAAQFEVAKNFQLTPFFVASGADVSADWQAKELRGLQDRGIAHQSGPAGSAGFAGRSHAKQG